MTFSGRLCIRGALRALMRPVLVAALRLEPRKEQPALINELAQMYAFLFKHLARISPRRVLDVGTGTSSLPHLMSHCGADVTATDSFGKYWPRRPLNRHVLVLEDDICNTRLLGTFDMITCIDVMQHVPQHARALEAMAGLLRPGGSVIVGCFFNETRYVADVYRLPGSGAINPPSNVSCQILSRAEIENWTRSTGLHVVDEELWRCFTGDLWTFGERLDPPTLATPAEPHHVLCLCLEKRKGVFAADRVADASWVPPAP